MEESHTKISRHDIKIIQKYQFFTKKNLKNTILKMSHNY